MSVTVLDLWPAGARRLPRAIRVLAGAAVDRIEQSFTGGAPILLPTVGLPYADHHVSAFDLESIIVIEPLIFNFEFNFKKN